MLARMVLKVLPSLEYDILLQDRSEIDREKMPFKFLLAQIDTSALLKVQPKLY